jgi:hypothetical protein
MSDSADELKAKILLDESNRRSRLLSILRRDRASPWWAGLASDLLLLIGAYLALVSFTLNQVFAIFVLAVALRKIIGNESESIHKRIDVLIELLQQEGSLRSNLARPRENQPPAGEEKSRIG